MNRIRKARIAWITGLMTAMILCFGADVQGAIIGETGTTFSFVVRPGHVLTSDGDSFLMWGYGLEIGLMQYPGPTLILTEDVPVTITLKNMLPIDAGNVSMIFPGHEVTATGGETGLLTQEAPPDGSTTVTYAFTPGAPGTYLYRSGTRPDLQVEMGLVGAMIVRPANTPPGGDSGKTYAYNHVDTHYDREFLYLLTEMDPRIHRQVESGQWDQIDTSSFFPTNWFVNGRNFPDLMAENNVPWLPLQPYNCQPQMHPGEKILIRYLGAGRDLHPMHYHGNDFETIAIDGRMLSSGPGAGPDLAWKATTIKSVPGQTADLLWTWTGEDLGWDIYGHAPTDPMEPGEYAPNHGVAFPVILPMRDAVTFGELYSGSPFLGGSGELPPGHPGLNAAGGYFFMWHSHTEKELTNYDIFPGGMLTMLIIEAYDVVID